VNPGRGPCPTAWSPSPVIAQFWLVHHRVFRDMAGQREGLAWWNFAFLLTITLMPFTSDLLGTFSANPLAVDIFGLNLLLASLATQATLVIALSVGIAWVSTDAAKYSWLLLAIAPQAAERWSARADR
jgi:uncharacterized membrane protein